MQMWRKTWFTSASPNGLLKNAAIVIARPRVSRGRGNLNLPVDLTYEIAALPTTQVSLVARNDSEGNLFNKPVRPGRPEDLWMSKPLLRRTFSTGVSTHEDCSSRFARVFQFQVYYQLHPERSRRVLLKVSPPRRTAILTTTIRFQEPDLQNCLFRRHRRDAALLTNLGDFLPLGLNRTGL